MKTKWAMCVVTAGLLLLAGCAKSDNTANEAAPAGSNAANNAAPGAGGQAGQSTGGSMAAQSPAPEPPQPLVVPAGTSIPVILSTSLSSRTNRPGDEFEGSVAAPVMVDGEVAIPKGAAVTGTVLDAKKQGAFKGEADLAIRLTKIRVNGKSYLVSTSAYAAREKGKGKRTAVVTGGGAALGALIGGLAGGGKGAAIGAGVGGGGGLAASGATGGKNVNLPVESRVTFKLTEPITIAR